MAIKYIRFLIRHYLFALLALAFTCAYWFSAKDLPTESIVFPKALLAVLIVLFVWNGVNSVREFKKTLKDESTPEEEKWKCSLNITSPKVVVTVMTLIYILAVNWLGFVVSTFLYLGILAYFLGIRKPIPLVLFSAGYTAVMYGIFVMWLMVPLPSGILI